MSPRWLSIIMCAALIAALTMLADTALAQQLVGFDQRLASITPGMAAYYASLFCIVGVLAFVTFSIGRPDWTAIALVMMAMVVWLFLNEQRLAGLYTYGPGKDAGLLAFSGQVLQALFVLSGLRAVASAGNLVWMRRYAVIGALIVLAAGIVSSFISPQVAFWTYDGTVIILGFTGLIPFWYLSRLPGETRYPVMVYAVTVSIPYGAFILALFFGFLTSGEMVTAMNRTMIAWIVCIGGFTAVRRVLAMREDRERVLRENLTVAQKEAGTSRALLESERKYAQVREIARLRQSRLAEASHDIKQPIASLRTTIDAVVRDQPPEIQTQLRNAFDYLEQLATSYMDDAREAPANAGHQRQETGVETVNTSLIVETLDRMFRAEAEEKGLIFDAGFESAEIRAQPLTVMRILSNLVSNAVKHTSEGTVSLGARIEEANVVLFVRNTDAGMSDKDLEHFFALYAKGAASSGSGLGLSIVKQLAENAGLTLSFDSDAISNTREFSLKLPVVKPSET